MSSVLVVAVAFAVIRTKPLELEYEDYISVLQSAKAVSFKLLTSLRQYKRRCIALEYELDAGTKEARKRKKTRHSHALSRMLHWERTAPIITVPRSPQNILTAAFAIDQLSKCDSLSSAEREQHGVLVQDTFRALARYMATVPDITSILPSWTVALKTLYPLVSENVRLKKLAVSMVECIIHRDIQVTESLLSHARSKNLGVEANGTCVECNRLWDARFRVIDALRAVKGCNYIVAIIEREMTNRIRGDVEVCERLLELLEVVLDEQKLDPGGQAEVKRVADLIVATAESDRMEPLHVARVLAVVTRMTAVEA